MRPCEASDSPVGFARYPMLAAQKDQVPAPPQASRLSISAASCDGIMPLRSSGNRPEHTGHTPVALASSRRSTVPSAGALPLPTQWPRSGIVTASLLPTKSEANRERGATRSAPGCRDTLGAVDVSRRVGRLVNSNQSAT
jgi:hypothetical protein